MRDAHTPGPDLERALLTALNRYREPRALDGASPSCLLERIGDLEHEAERHRRRAEAVDRAMEEMGLPRGLAEQAYDLAREEGLEPVFGLEIVRCGVAVCEPAPGPDAETIQQSQPEWLDRPLTPDEARRERTLRLSFRRLRGLLQEHERPESALRAFANEPDVGECEF